MGARSQAGRWPRTMVHPQQRTQAAAIGTAEHPGIRCAMGYDLYVISPGTGFLALFATTLAMRRFGKVFVPRRWIATDRTPQRS
jgi:hypothetical protein